MIGRALRAFLALLAAGWLLPASAAARSAPTTGGEPWAGASETVAAAAAPAPTNLATDADGNVYVTDYTFDRVLKFSPDGTLLAQWGGYGAEPGQFSRPFGVAVSAAGSVYVVDQLNSRVQKFTSDGTFLTLWGSPGSGVGQLQTPFGVAVAPGVVYVADFRNDRIQAFSSEGQVLGLFGTMGTSEGQFLRPAGVAVDGDGNILVSDHFNDRVQKLTPDGSFLGQIGAPAGAAGVAVPTLVASPSSAAPLPDGQLRRPEGLALGADGSLYVADYGRNRVAAFGPHGHFLFAWGSRGSNSGEFLGPKGVAVDPVNGRVYVADTGNGRIQRFATDGTFQTSWALP